MFLIAFRSLRSKWRHKFPLAFSMTRELTQSVGSFMGNIPYLTFCYSFTFKFPFNAKGIFLRRCITGFTSGSVVTWQIDGKRANFAKTCQILLSCICWWYLFWRFELNLIFCTSLLWEWVRNLSATINCTKVPTFLFFTVAVHFSTIKILYYYMRCYFI